MAKGHKKLINPEYIIERTLPNPPDDWRMCERIEMKKQKIQVVFRLSS